MNHTHDPKLPPGLETDAQDEETMVERRITLPDGRYLIFFTFPPAIEKSGAKSGGGGNPV